jgi:hypothetical protein
MGRCLLADADYDRMDGNSAFVFNHRMFTSMAIEFTRLTAPMVTAIIQQHRPFDPQRDYATDLNAAWELRAEMPIEKYNHLLPIHQHNHPQDLALLLARCYVQWKGWELLTLHE